MRLPNCHLSAETLLDVHSTYHLARLKGDPDCEELESLFAPAHDSLQTTICEYRAARLAAMTATAFRDGQEAALDDAVRDFSLLVLGKVHNVRTSPVFVGYFPGGTTEITRASREAKLTLVGSILVKLAAETDPGIQAFEGTLRAAHEGMRAAVQAHHEALDTKAHRRSVARAEVVRWRGAYRRSHKDLDRKFYQHPPRVESYFQKPRNGKREDGSGEDALAAEQPAAGAVRGTYPQSIVPAGTALPQQGPA
jgi:hypothetical protein